MTAEASCLGCGLIREPSTWDLTSHAFLCVECVGAIRVRHHPALVENLLSAYLAGIVIPTSGRWDEPVRYESGGTVKEVADRGFDTMHGRVEEFCRVLLVNVVGPTSRPGRTPAEICEDLATQLEDFAGRLRYARLGEQP